MAKIAFVNTLPVPSGEASVNRILSLAKGLVECGDEVFILSSGISYERTQYIEINGIKIYNLGESKSVFGLAKSLNKIIQLIKCQKFDYVVAITSSSLLLWSLFFTCRILNIRYARDLSEFPFVLMKAHGFLGKIYAKLNVQTIYRLFDDVFIMTNPLIEFFKDKLNKHCRILHLPMTVDSNRFELIKKVPTKLGRYIAYCGNMSDNKDGVENLIHAFGQISNSHPDVSLLLIGGTNKKSQLERLKDIVQEHNYRNIIFYGRISRDAMPCLLKNAEVLALARPSSIQSLGGFPTKLGEYLSTQNPVVITAVGDIPLYLNERNSYLVPPDDITSFASALDEALYNPNEAKMRGKNGYQLVKSVFDYRVQTKRLHEFLNQPLLI